MLGRGKPLDYNCATIIVAAHDASRRSKDSADFVCDGIGDQEEIMLAYAMLQRDLEYIGGKIQLTEGTFLCNDTITFFGHTPFSLWGVGMLIYWPIAGFQGAGTQVKLADGADCMLFEMYGEASESFAGGEIHGIWFDGNRDNNTGPSYGINIQDFGDMMIANCMFRHFNHTIALRLAQHNTWMFGCDIEDNTKEAIRIQNSQNWIINNCFARNGSALGSYPDIGIKSSFGQWILNNLFWESYHNIIKINEDNKRDIFIRNNLFFDWGEHVDSAAIWILNPISDTFISGNIFEANNHGRWGIYCDPNLNRVKINDNIFRNFTTPAEAIVLGGVLTDCEVRGNAGWKTENGGAAAGVADGGTIAHGLIATPTYVQAVGSVAGEFVQVTAIGAANFTVAIKKHDGTAGTAQTIYWRAWYQL